MKILCLFGHCYIPLTIAETVGPSVEIVRPKMIGFCGRCGDSVPIATLPDEPMRLNDIEINRNLAAMPGVPFHPARHQ